MISLLLPEGSVLLADKESTLPCEPSQIPDKRKYSQIFRVKGECAAGY